MPPAPSRRSTPRSTASAACQTPFSRGSLSPSCTCGCVWCVAPLAATLQPCNAHNAAGHAQVRLKAEGSDGKRVYKEMVTLFWADVDYRMRAMGVGIA